MSRTHARAAKQSARPLVDRQSADSPTLTLKFAVQGAVLEQFVGRRDFVKGVIGPLGSGKTYAAIMQILALCHHQTPCTDGVRRSRWCIARNTLPDLFSATIPDVKEIVDQVNPDGWNMQAPVSWEHSYHRSDGTTVQIQLWFRSFDGLDDVKKARGMQLTGCWTDEVAEFHKENLDMLIGRVKRYPSRAQCPKGARFQVLLTSNACARDHWLAEAAKNPAPGWWIGVQPGGVIRQGNQWVENPAAENLKNLPRHYYLDQCAHKKDSWIRLNLANEFVVHTDGRPIHPDFNEQLHVQPCKATPGLPLHVGIDYGRTPAATILQRQADGQWYVLRELVTYNMGADKFAPILKRLLSEEFSAFKVAAFTDDPSGSSMAQTRDETPADLMASAGIYTQPASTNDPEVRYATLDNLLTQLIGGQPAIIVDPGCTTLVRGLAGEYQFRRLKVTDREEYKDAPDKGPTSHVCESLHYGLMGAGESEQLFDQEFAAQFAEVESWAPPSHYFE